MLVEAGWKVGREETLVVERDGFRTTIAVVRVSGCTCGSVRFQVGMMQVRRGMTFVRPTGESFELTFAPGADDEVVLSYLMTSLSGIALGKPLGLCPNVPTVMQPSYQFTETAAQRCRCGRRAAD
ncbi:hypothetical protein [Polyangium sp. 15x6]|uniref:hypothetical protein n=1 Tax=Polyangium sp. 15x6 TaxID=3042687 RepID=UPI00249CCA4E|nr:hypothetical protein [Polyangium sp. 15x6]MDI3282088.1 hypothetical protein [Polyangium sp. 15x6]